MLTMKTYLDPIQADFKYGPSSIRSPYFHRSVLFLFLNRQRRRDGREDSFIDRKNRNEFSQKSSMILNDTSREQNADESPFIIYLVRGPNMFLNRINKASWLMIAKKKFGSEDRWRRNEIFRIILVFPSSYPSFLLSFPSVLQLMVSFGLLNNQPPFFSILHLSSPSFHFLIPADFRSIHPSETDCLVSE
jgi:hypothetical protein